MLIFIGLIILFFIGKFFYDKNEQSIKVAKEGGMINKYDLLITTILGGHQNTKIYKLTGDSVELGAISFGGSTMYTITQTFGKVTVQWRINNPIYGQHKLEWDFPEYLDQEKMLIRIMNDIGAYQNNVAKALNLPGLD